MAGCQPSFAPRLESAHDNGGVLTYIRWYWPDDDVWNYEELDGDRCSIRHVEVAGDGLVVAASSLAEVLAARDSGSIEAVQRYESRYGGSPVGSFPDQSDEYPIEAVAQDVFDELWRTGRQRLRDQDAT